MSSLLLIPTETHRAAIFARSWAGGVVPVRRRCGCGAWDHSGCSEFMGAVPQALILVRYGTPDDIACDRLARVLKAEAPLRWTVELAEAIADCAVRREVGQLVRLEEGVGWWLGRRS